MISLVKLYNEIKVNNPNITPEDIFKLMKELEELKSSNNENYLKYSYFWVFEKFGLDESPYTLEPFIETLPKNKLVSLYQELLKIKNQ